MVGVMSKIKNSQYSVVTEVLKNGNVEIILPGNTRLEIGITQEGEDGLFHKTKDYCWIIVTQNDKEIYLDNYNMGMKCDSDKIMLVEYFDDDNGKNVKNISVS